MIGAIIGDIVGSRFEFNNHRSTDFELFHKDCNFTDDTIMTVATADALLNNKDFASAYREWGHKYPMPMGGYGASFAYWLNSPHPQPYNSFGNGAAMRVSPIGLFYSDRCDVRNMALNSAKVSHNHPEGMNGAETIAVSIWMLHSAFTKKDVKKYVESQGYNLSRTTSEIRQTNRFDETCQGTIPEAVTCFLESKSFEEAVRLAISIGGDSDTIAAITGSLAEAHYGVPPKLTAKAFQYLPNEIVNIIDSFY